MSTSDQKASRYLTKMDSRHRVALPAVLHRAVGLKPGGDITIWQLGHLIVLRPRQAHDQLESHDGPQPS